MANASIGGLVSGLDTATIISQLMQLEARPQTMLKSKVSSAARAVTAMQTLNAKLVAIGAKAAELDKRDAWLPMSATASTDMVAVTAESTAQLTSLTFSVKSTASAARAMFSNAYEKMASTGTASTITIDYDDSRALRQLTVTDTSLQGLADAINDAAGGLQATLVRAGGSETNPTFRLQVVSTTTGATSGFKIYDGAVVDDAAAATATQILGGSPPAVGADAIITISGQDISSSTNSITDLMPGVDVALSQDVELNKSITITIARDVDSLASKVKAMVDAANNALDELASLTKTGADAKDRGMLAGDSTLRGVRDKLIESITHGVNGESLAAYGIQVDRYGKVTFDEAKFKAAYDADPNKTAAMFAGADDTVTTDGFAGTLQSLSKTFSDSIEGTVTLSIKSRQSAIKGWEDDIADWDVRLAARQTTLQRQYTALESALGKLQSQGNWLAGQIASLPQMSSGS